MGVVDVYVRVFCVYPVSELTWITIYDYGEVVLPHGWDNRVRMVITQKPWVKSVPVTLKLSVFSGALIWKFEIVEFDIVSMR
jgi:hypothetical protein